MAASEAPATPTSTEPSRMNRCMRPMACEAVAQALTVPKVGPLMP